MAAWFCRSPENSREDKKTRTIAGHLEEPCGYLQNLPNMVRNSPVNCCPHPYFHGDYGSLVQILVQTLVSRPPVVERGGGGEILRTLLTLALHSFYPKLSASHRTQQLLTATPVTLIMSHPVNITLRDTYISQFVS